MSETDGEEEESPTVAKKDKGGHEHGAHAAMKKLPGLLFGHLSHTQENNKRYVFLFQLSTYIEINISLQPSILSATKNSTL